MNVVWDFIFFFEHANQNLQSTFPNVFKNGNRNENRHATSNWIIMKPYGWLNTLYDVAKTGLFTFAPFNAIDSVRHENLFKIFTFLSWKSANNEYENEVKKGMEKEAQSKANARKNKR